MQGSKFLNLDHCLDHWNKKGLNLSKQAIMCGPDGTVQNPSKRCF